MPRCNKNKHLKIINIGKVLILYFTLNEHDLTNYITVKGDLMYVSEITCSIFEFSMRSKHSNMLEFKHINCCISAHRIEKMCL